MKKVIIILLTLGFCARTVAESKTEIVVKEGIVKTTTNQGDSLIRRGQKAVLKEGQLPQVTLNDPIVEKLLQMNQQIEEERAESKERIDSMIAGVFSLESEKLVKFGAILELTNYSEESQTTLRFGPASAIENFNFYTLEGLPLRHKTEKINEWSSYYYIHFDTPIAPQGKVKIMSVQEYDDTSPDWQKYKDLVLKKEDGLWRLYNQDDSPYCLKYFHYILPPSAIFVRSDPPLYTIEQQDGRVAVTIRKYSSAENAVSPFFTYFLWPEKDGASLSGIPWTNAGSEAVSIYDMFISENIQSPELWGELAIKLVGGGFYDEAYDAFERCYNDLASAMWVYTALTWQGHLLDLSEQRDEAIEKYQQALKIKPPQDMRHDQWGIVLTQRWIKDRLEKPFTEEMFIIIPEWKKEFKERFEALPWKNAGHDVLQLYNDIVFNDIIKIDTLEAPDWARLGLKLVGAAEGYYSQAMNCFDRSQTGGATGMYLFCTLIWQGHLFDLKGDRQHALEKYHQALEMNNDEIGKMRHDQWRIVLTKDWIRWRIESPFTENMLLYPELNYRQHPEDSIAEPGLRLGDLYLDMTKEQVMEILGQPDEIFYRDQQYTLDNLPGEYCMAYPDYGVLIENNKVFELTTGSRFYQLPNGIRVGDTMQQVTEKLGTNYEYQVEQDQTDVLRYNNLGLKFEIDKTESTVARIEIFRLK